MERVVMSKGVILFYVISLLITYLVVVRVDSLNNITNEDNAIVYNANN